MNLKTKTLPEGEVGQEYYTEITASIKNSFFDSYYDYNYDLDSGTLPEGLFLQNEGDIAIISGIPEEAGLFEIGIEVYSNDLAHQEAYDPLLNCIDSDDFATLDLLIAEGVLEEPVAEEEPPEEAPTEEEPAVEEPVDPEPDPEAQ